MRGPIPGTGKRNPGRAVIANPVSKPDTIRISKPDSQPTARCDSFR